MEGGQLNKIMTFYKSRKRLHLLFFLGDNEIIQTLPDSRDRKAEDSESETPFEVRWFKPDQHPYDFLMYKNTSEWYNKPNLTVQWQVLCRG